MQKIIYLIIAVGAIYFGIQYMGSISTSSKLLAEVKTLCTDEHVDRVEVSDTMIKTTSNLPGGGMIYFRADGSSIVCPVVGPNSETQECKTAAAMTDWKLVCPTE